MLIDLTKTESGDVLPYRYWRGYMVVFSPWLPRTKQDAMLFEVSNRILGDCAGVVPPIKRIELQRGADQSDPDIVILVFESHVRVLTYEERE